MFEIYWFGGWAIACLITMVLTIILFGDDKKK